MKKMSLVKFAMITLFLSTAVLACNKEKHDPPAPVIEGKFVGAYGFASDIPSIFYSLNFKPGGVIEELDDAGQVKGTGTFQVNGNILTAKYVWASGTDFSIRATYNQSVQELVNGTWGWDNSYTDGGTWSMQKQ
jgi:hypothetical protein